MRYSIIEIDGKEIDYKPIVPQADSIELSEKSPRLMIFHGGLSGERTRIWVAPIGEFSSGWVLGTVYESRPISSSAIQTCGHVEGRLEEQPVIGKALA